MTATPTQSGRSTNVLLRSLFSNYVTQVYTACINIALLPFVLSKLGPASFGIVAFASLLAVWINLYEATVGAQMLQRVGTTFTRDRGYFDRMIASMEACSLVVGCLALAAHVLFSRGVYHLWLNTDGLADADVALSLTLMGVVTLLRIQEATYRNLLIALEKHRLLNKIVLIAITVKVVATVAAVCIWPGLLAAYFYAQVGAAVFGWGAFVLVCYQRFLVRWSISNLDYRVFSSTYKIGRDTFLHNALVLILGQLDRIFLSRVLSIADFGYYSLVYSIAYAFFMLLGPAVQIFRPKLFNSVQLQDNVRLRHDFHLGSHIVAAMCSGIALLMAFYSSDVLRLYTQNSDLASRFASALTMLILANWMNGLLWVMNIVYFAAGRSMTIININVGLTVAYVAVMALGYPLYGVMAVPAGWLAVNLIMFLMLPVLGSRNVLRSEVRSWYVRDLGSVIWAPALFLAGCKWFLPTPESSVQTLTWLVILAGTAGVLSIVSSPYLRGEALKSLSRRTAMPPAGLRPCSTDDSR